LDKPHNHPVQLQLMQLDPWHCHVDRHMSRTGGPVRRHLSGTRTDT